MSTTKPMQLFEAAGSLVVAKDKSDARRVMREEWGEVFPAKRVRRSVDMTYDDEHTFPMRPSEVVKLFPRGPVPEV